MQVLPADFFYFKEQGEVGFVIVRGGLGIGGGCKVRWCGGVLG